MSTSLETRMRRYEDASRGYLTPRMPVVIRLDGKSFKAFTRKFNKPFDDLMVYAMKHTMKYLCMNIQGCVLGYTQSDEISLILVDYKKHDTAPWFDYCVQKCASVAASMATLEFNRQIEWAVSQLPEEAREQYEAAITLGALFDARVYNVPKEDVTNYLYWRQQDGIRNSISATAQAHFSHRMLHGKSREEQLKLLQDKYINWEEFPIAHQRGCCCKKVQVSDDARPKWIIDTEIPVFAGDSRKYVDDLIYVGE